MSQRSRARTAHQRSTTRWVIAGLAAAIVVAAAVAVVAGSGSGGSSGVEGVEQTRPVTVTGTALATLPKSGADPAIGQQAPQLSGQSFDGTPVVVKPGSHPTLLVLLAHWCPHCRREVPKLVEWQNDGGMPAGLDVVGIATATDPSAPNFPPSKWLEDAGWPWPVMADSDTSTAAQAMGLPGFPYFVLLKPDGTVALRLSGEIETTDLTAKIEAALA